MNKKTRRFLKRVSSRTQTGSLTCLENFYKEGFDKNQVYSFYKKRRKGFGRKNKLSKKEKQEKLKIKNKMLELVRRTFIIEK
jgi:hypothetical protein